MASSDSAPILIGSILAETELPSLVVTRYDV